MRSTRRSDLGLLLGRAMNAAAGQANGIDIEEDRLAAGKERAQQMLCCFVFGRITKFSRDNSTIEEAEIDIGRHKIAGSDSGPFRFAHDLSL